ncbi:gamma-glutamyltransferase family protein [Halovenus rubra]|uniref:Gamma-glutamyltransferase family protein n=2 Tax=Halovenus rubra TaxID=869890 RepID=A0ABD5X4Y5_9EURY|nr:gamma-glutamyltransferase family protein [Halovenus rubra]
MDPDIDSFDSRRSTVYAPNGIVATSQPLAAEAGVEILREGGNAFDAAVATAAALNVVEPTSTGLGGDVFACYRTADGEVGAMRAAGGAPQESTLSGVRERVADGKDKAPGDVSMPMHGPHTVTVPGTARGWEATVEELGRLSLSDVLDPAIGYAIDGYPVTEVVSAQWQHAEDLFNDAHAREAYLFDGQAPSVGQTAVLPRLGESMQRIAEQGADAVYEGPIGEAIVEEIQQKGGFMTIDDLAEFEVEWPEPLSTTYGDSTIYELGPHNQGQLALEALNIAEEIGAGDHPYDSPERVHDFAEAMKLAFHDGHYHVTDPEYEDVPPLHSKGYARQRADEISEEPISDVAVGTPNASGEDADTVLLCAADDQGNIVSFINSRFAGFGSGLVAGETGIALQNRGASFSLDPDHPNRIEPGKRPFHTLVPGLAKVGEDDWLAFGVMGGYMQPQGHVQLISNLVDYDMPLQAALDAPRWRYREEGTLAVEEQIHEGIPTKLARKGHDVRVLYPGLFGGAQAVRNNEGTLSGATEPRKDGQVSGY